MSLRAKLVIALGVMLALGLLAFGIGTYSQYSSAEYRRLDDRLRSSLLSAERELHDSAGIDPGGGPGSPDGPADPRTGDGRSLGIGSYAELHDGTGTVLAHLPNDTSSASPSIPDAIGALDKPFTTGSFTGSGNWRALASVDSRFPNLTVIVATPLGDVAESLRGLVLIESIAAVVILALLTAGAWLILRRGLRPLETMAVAAGSINGGDMSLRITPADVDLAVLAADACSDAVATAPDRQITLDARAPVRVAGVVDHLRQAVANLVSNALTHTPAGTPIEVSAIAIAHRGLVVVRDHGTGLGDEALLHAFDRFWQADPSRAGPKSGLGLSIVQAIAESHGGTASVRNHPDGGAEFTIDLPLQPNLALARTLPPPSVVQPLARPPQT